jgi:hypothetical protein
MDISAQTQAARTSLTAGCGPEREIHADGTQSMALPLFTDLFVLGGGQALLS